MCRLSVPVSARGVQGAVLGSLHICVLEIAKSVPIY